MLMGIRISHSTHQRLVHRQTFAGFQASAPVETLCIDGGKARIRTPKGEPCTFNDYKAVVLEGHGINAYFKRNEALIAWVKSQPLTDPVSCIGDGHDGIWNLFQEITRPEHRCERLDWYHLVENLYKVGGSLNRLSAARSFLWEGKVEDAIAEFSDCQLDTVDNFIAYVTKHRDRLINYHSYQAEGFTIGSGSVESGVKQISRRVKISGAQWAAKNVDQVVKHRCAYLNGQFSTRSPFSQLIAKP